MGWRGQFKLAVGFKWGMTPKHVKFLEEAVETWFTYQDVNSCSWVRNLARDPSGSPPIGTPNLLELRRVVCAAATTTNIKSLKRDRKLFGLLSNTCHISIKKNQKEANGIQRAGKRGGDRTSNAQWAKNMLRVGFTKIAMWQTSKK